MCFNFCVLVEGCVLICVREEGCVLVSVSGKRYVYISNCRMLYFLLGLLMYYIQFLRAICMYCFMHMHTPLSIGWSFILFPR